MLPSHLQDDISMLKKGSFGSKADVQEHCIWDTIVFPATVSSEGIQFFTKGMGGTYGSALGFSKEKGETNLQDGKMPAGQGFIAKKMSISLISFRAKADLDTTEVVSEFGNIIKNSYWQIQLPGKSEFESEFPGTHFFPSIQEIGYYSNTPNQNAIRMGDYNHHTWMSLAVPLVLDELVTFKVICRVGAAESSAGVATSVTTLNTRKAAIRFTFKGTLVRSK